MRYIKEGRRNWGVLIASSIAVPLALAWIVIDVIGGSLVCADEEARCAGVVWPLLSGLAVIAAMAVIIGWMINRMINGLSRHR